MDRSNPISGLDKTQGPKDFSEPVIQNKPTKRTSNTAFVAIISALYGFYFCLLFFGITTGWRSIDFDSPIFPILVFFALPIAGMITLVVLLRKNKSKVGNILVVIFIILFFSTIAWPSYQRTKQGSKVVHCSYNLDQLGKAIIQYAEAHNGYFPVPDQWCDLLIQQNEHLSKHIFKCPAAKNGICNYSFNKNLSGFRLADVPNNVVLLYEADGGWNCTGGPELLSIRHINRRLCNVLFVDGTIKHYYAEELVKQPLRWQP